MIVLWCNYRNKVIALFIVISQGSISTFSVFIIYYNDLGLFKQMAFRLWWGGEGICNLGALGLTLVCALWCMIQCDFTFVGGWMGTLMRFDPSFLWSFSPYFFLSLYLFYILLFIHLIEQPWKGLPQFTVTGFILPL